MTPKIIVLGTGGTIAGTAQSAHDHTGYTAAQIGIAALLEGVPGMREALCGAELVSEQVAQLDSKDMDFATMQRLVAVCVQHLAQPQIKGIVVTHGTDTLEETAYFLHRVIPSELQRKPIVLTCAMRPATSSEADGPRNLRDAVRVACAPQAHGVLAVCAGDVHHALSVQKIHSHALNAFSSGDVALGEPGLVAQVVGEQVLWNTSESRVYEEKWPVTDIESKKYAIYLVANSSSKNITWPRVEIVLNHTQATGSVVRALLDSTQPDDPLRGIVVAGTGNGTLSQALESALLDAQVLGIRVLRSSRCAFGGVSSTPKDALGSTSLSWAKARIALMLDLLAASPS